MSMEPYTASLHAGLIQRTRPGPATVLPLPDGDAPGLRANILALRGGALPVARGAAALRESDIRPERVPQRVPEHVPIAPVQSAPETRRGWSFRRRFGLTVRVGDAVRELLLRARMRTGRTTQSILHDALVQYLAGLDRERGPR